MSGDPEHVEPLRVAVVGACGRMGREVVKAVSEGAGVILVSAVDHAGAGCDAGELAGTPPLGVSVETDLAFALERTHPDVLVDFTVPASVFANAALALKRGVSPVIGATGLTPADLEELDALSRAVNTPAFVAPNFAIGAVLMMEFACQAARFMPDVEIIELHHENKLDAPSGTALLTAARIAEARSAAGVQPAPLPRQGDGEQAAARGAAGARTGGIPVHSVRLPGFVAHQEVIFGAAGQVLTIRHDSTDRKSFMPGVLLAIRRVRELEGLVVGLEKLLL